MERTVVVEGGAMTVVSHPSAVTAGLVAAAGFGLGVVLVARGRAVPVGRLAELGESTHRDRVVTDADPARPARRRRWSDDLAGLDRGPLALAAVGGGVVVSLAVGSPGPGLAAVLALVIVNAVLSGWSRRQRVAFDAALPDVIDGLAAAIRSGSIPRVALLEAGAAAPAVVAGDIAVIAARLERGERLADAMAWWARHRDRASLHLLCAVVATSAEFGGPLGDVLASVAARLREDLRSGDEIRTQSAQAVASAVMLVLLPVISLAITAMADPGVLAFLFGTPLGAACLLVGVTLELGGAWWMWAIVRGVR